MARKIKGFVFKDRIKDAWEEYKAIKYYQSVYNKKDLKILHMKNQYGQSYTDIYVKKGAKPIRKLKYKIGSAMTFESIDDKTLYGDKIQIKR